MPYTKTTWVDKAVQFAKRYYMNTDGGNDKNLLPPFTDWTLHANAVATLPYTLTLTATAASQDSTFTLFVIEGQQYTLSINTTVTSGSFVVYVNDGAIAAISNLSGYRTTTFTVPAGTTSITVRIRPSTAGTFTFTNFQLELGSTATAFTPKKLYTITQSGGTVTQAGTPVNAANLNKIETALESMIGKDNTSIVETTSLKLETDTRNNTLTYTNGILTQVVEKDGSTTMKTTTLNYTNGLLTTVVEVGNGKTITTTLSYTNGDLTGTSKTVV